MITRLTSLLTALLVIVCLVLLTTDNVAPAQTATSNQPGRQVIIDDSRVTAAYANFTRVTGTPEEIIFDFGLNPQPIGVPEDPIVINQRIVMNFYTAKRLVAAIQMSIDRHEQVFGTLETDVEKRVKSRP
jgi:hypothetical protein